MGIVIGIIVVLGLAAFFAVLTCRSKKSDLFKWIGIAFFVAFCLTWVIPYGYFSSGSFVSYGMSRLGFSDVPTIMYYAVYFCLTTLLYLFVIGGFYGVISKTKSYQALVNKFAKGVKGNEVLTTILMIVLLVALTSITKSPLNMVVFLPFLVSVLRTAKFDKLTTTGITFGSVLVGTLAATYGTDGLTFLNQYIEADVTVGFWYRLILGAVALVLFTLYNVYRVVKAPKKSTKKEETDGDLFAVEAVKGKAAIWPAIVVLSVLAVFVILAYVGWNTSFKLPVFDKFHEWLLKLSFFKVSDADFTIFSYILGTNATAFGMMEITALISFLLILSVIVALMNKVSLEDFMNNFGEGFKKMLKPAALYALAYCVFIVVYMCPFTATMTDWAYGLTKTFNPYIATATAFVTSLFQADLGYTGYLLGTVFTGTYASHLDILHTIYVSTYGLVQVFMPTSGLLLVGLAYMNVDYKKWFKYIWLFAVTMIVALLILATIVVYL